jgi:hypothetical protein
MPATASAAAWNHQTVNVGLKPTSADFDRGSRCVLRRLHLRGRYIWETEYRYSYWYGRRWRHSTVYPSARVLRLRRGTYVWNDCMTPRVDRYGQPFWYHRSHLNRTGPAGNAYLSDFPAHSSHVPFDRYGWTPNHPSDRRIATFGTRIRNCVETAAC